MNEPVVKSNISMDDHVDTEIATYLDLDNPRSFFLFAGAGSGKTRSLVNALNSVQERYGRRLTANGQKLAVITYTNAACDEINRRVAFHPLFHVSTIHSFVWELINGFHSDIREWLRHTLSEDLDELHQAEAKGRAGTKASITRLAKIESKSKRLQRLDSISAFTYSPSGENSEPNSLNHSEVIAICADFLTQKSLMRAILVGRFPFLLIDESQDTNKRLVDALFEVEAEQSDRFALGLIGDLMQRIYQDGKERIEEELPDRWAKPQKQLNHRCPKRVIELINKIRDEADGQKQVARSDAIEGCVRLFVLPTATAERTLAEDSIRQFMADVAGDPLWAEPKHSKVLILEHHMAARRLGFERVFGPLSQVDNWRTGLLEGTLPPLRFFTHSVLPLIQAKRAGNEFAVSKLVRQSSPLLTASSLQSEANPTNLLREAQAGITELMALWDVGEPTCGDVLRCVAARQLFETPDSLIPALDVLNTEITATDQDEEADPVGERVSATLEFLKAPFAEVEIYLDYVDGVASYDTHQGVKGREFDRVMVIIDDSEARGFMFGYGKLLGDGELSATDLKNIKEGKDSAIDRTRRLLYVTCSRAERSLAIVVYADQPEIVRDHILKVGWFAADEVCLIDK